MLCAIVIVMSILKITEYYLIWQAKYYFMYKYMSKFTQIQNEMITNL